MGIHIFEDRPDCLRPGLNLVGSIDDSPRDDIDALQGLLDRVQMWVRLERKRLGQIRGM